MNRQETKATGRRGYNAQRGFSMIELLVVIGLILTVTAIAVIQLPASLQNVRTDNAMRQVLDQLRQAREYAIANRRYVQITFPVVGGQSEVQMAQVNTCTAGGGGVNPVLSTIPIQAPMQFYVFPALPDTPDLYGKAAAIEFGNTNGGPLGGMFFQSDGELGTLTACLNFQPINGTVFLGVAGNATTARAVTVLGTNGTSSRMEAQRSGVGSILKETATMRQKTVRQRANGFTLLETMIALVILAVGLLGMAAMLGDSLAYMAGSQYEFIAQQKAEQAVEAIYTAKYTNTINWNQVANINVGNPLGLFLPGPQPLTITGPDGLVGSVNDVAAVPDYILDPGPDGKLGTADDVRIPLSTFTRTITITPYVGDNNLRNIQVTVNYSAGRINRSYTLNTLISAFD